MGTSNSFGGPSGSTPLVPSWLGGDNNGDPPPTGPAAPPMRPPIPPAEPPKRFTPARTNFARFARSGGSDRTSLGRAISQYVSGASHGARNAAARMGSSRNAGANLLSFLTEVNTRGARAALRTLNLEALTGRPIEEVFVGLLEFICPDGGTVDEGIAREAFIETIADLAAEGVTDLDELTAGQMQTVFELYVMNAIEARICNDIGTKVVSLPNDAHQARLVEEQLKDFIRGGVSDAMTRARAGTPTLTPDRINDFVNEVYEQAFSILQTMGEAEVAGT